MTAPSVSIEELVQSAQERGELLPIGVVLRIGLAVAIALEGTGADPASDTTAAHGALDPRSVRIDAAGVAHLGGRAGGRWAAPEQKRGGIVDGKSDLHALGALIHELLTLQPPPEAETGAPPDPDDHRRDVPPALVELLFALLAVEREARPADAHEVVRALRALLDDAIASEGAPDLAPYLPAAIEPAAIEPAAIEPPAIAPPPDAPARRTARPGPVRRARLRDSWWVGLAIGVAGAALAIAAVRLATWLSP